MRAGLLRITTRLINASQKHGDMNVVFSKPRYVLLFALLTIFIYVLIAWIPRLSFLLSTIINPNIPFAEALGISAQALVASLFLTSASESAYAIFTSVLVASNITLITFVVRRAVTPRTSVAIGSLGTLVAVIGLGCISCGSVILLAIVTTFGGSLIAALPFQGKEFGAIGVVLLLSSIYLLDKTARKPPVCST
jgi:hypothetical protein